MRRHRREVLERLDRLAAALRVTRAQRRREDALQQLRLAVGRAAEHAQVATADPVPRELGDGPDDLPLGLVVVAHAGAQLALDHAELDQLAHESRFRAGLLDDVLDRVQRTRVPRRDERPAVRAAVGRCRRRRALSLCAPAGEFLPNHPERQELVPLQTQDRPQPLDVVLGVEPVAALGAARREQLLVLQVADLRDRDVRELLLERLAHGSDRDRLLAGPFGFLNGRIGDLDGGGVAGFGSGHQRLRNASLYLPIWSSSPSTRWWDSIRRRLTYVPLSDPQS